MSGAAVETVLDRDLNHRLPDQVVRLLSEEPLLDRAYVVGGFVRDGLLGGPARENRMDVDIEVFGRSWRELVRGLRRWGRVQEVGKSFGTIKLFLRNRCILDLNLPRQERKTGPGHRGFEVDCRPDLPLDLAMRRRDFTINALYYDSRRKRVIDCHGGLEDLRLRRLRVVDEERFPEDPLRVLRAMQFLSRFGLDPAGDLARISRGMVDDYSSLARERVCDEWFKWATRGRIPSKGLEFLVEGGWVAHFPEIESLCGLQQDPEWHPEGDVFRHVCFCCDAMAESEEWQRMEETDRAVYMLAMLLHDAGKASTTREDWRRGRLRIVSPGHERQGVPLADRFLERLGMPHVVRRRVIPLVANHMVHYQDVSNRAIRRLAVRLQPETIEGLCLVMEADAMGRPPLPRQVPATVTLLREKSAELQVDRSAPERVLKGRDLIPLGVPPGPRMGDLLDRVYQVQLDGLVSDRESAVDWLRLQGLI